MGHLGRCFCRRVPGPQQWGCCSCRWKGTSSCQWPISSWAQPRPPDWARRCHPRRCRRCRRCNTKPVTNSILFGWLFLFKDQCKKVRFQQTYTPGWPRLFLTVPLPKWMILHSKGNRKKIELVVAPAHGQDGSGWGWDVVGAGPVAAGTAPPGTPWRTALHLASRRWHHYLKNAVVFIYSSDTEIELQSWIINFIDFSHRVILQGRQIY